jgi:hypothetical protein
MHQQKSSGRSPNFFNHSGKNFRGVLDYFQGVSATVSFFFFFFQKKRTSSSASNIHVIGLLDRVDKCSMGPHKSDSVPKIFFPSKLLVVSHSYNVAEQVKDSLHIPKTALAIKITKMPINKLSAKTEPKLAGRNYSSP